MYYWTSDRTYTRAPAAPDIGAKFIVKQRGLFGSTQRSGLWICAVMDSAHRKITDTSTGDIVVEDNLKFNDFDRDIFSISLDAYTHLVGKQLQLRSGVRCR